MPNCRRHIPVGHARKVPWRDSPGGQNAHTEYQVNSGNNFAPIDGSGAPAPAPDSRRSCAPEFPLSRPTGRLQNTGRVWFRLARSGVGPLARGPGGGARGDAVEVGPVAVAEGKRPRGRGWSSTPTYQRLPTARWPPTSTPVGAPQDRAGSRHGADPATPQQGGPTGKCPGQAEWR